MLSAPSIDKPVDGYGQTASNHSARIMYEDILGYLLAFIGSFVAGCINTLAGNGSVITLTILTEVLGLPATMANGTNRVGIFTQSAAASWSFYRSGRLDFRTTGSYILFACLGAIAGVLVAVRVSNEQFEDIFRYLMLFMLLVVLVKPDRWLQATDRRRSPGLWVTIPLFLALGFYGGFIQMGMGIFFLAATVLGARFGLIDANAMKSFIIAVFTLLALVIFHWNGLVDWRYGGLMAIGQTIGGYLTAHYAARFPAANVWAYRVLVVMIIIACLTLFDLHKLFTS